MKFLCVVALIALAIQLTVAQSSTATTVAATTTTTAASTATTTTTAASVTTTSATTKKPNKFCWRGNNWCNTRQQVKCKNPKKCIKTIVVVRRRKN